MKDSLINDLKKRNTSAFDVFHKDLVGLRTGRASASLLESIVVDAYGAKTPITQVANISVPEARLLTVQVWDHGLAGMVEKAIRDSGLGLNPSAAGAVIRVPLPELSEERRKELVKVAGKYAEQGRVAVRNVRRDILEKVKKHEKDGDFSEDDARKITTDIQKVTDDFIKKIDDDLITKEKEILHRFV